MLLTGLSQQSSLDIDSVLGFLYLVVGDHSADIWENFASAILRSTGGNYVGYTRIPHSQTVYLFICMVHTVVLLQSF